MAKPGLKKGAKCIKKKCVKNKAGHSAGCPTNQVKRCAKYKGTKKKPTKRKTTKRKTTKRKRK